MTITITTIPAPTSPVTGPIAVTRCQCRGPLAALTVPAPTDADPRATKRILVHTDPDATCDTATPELCAHPHCWSEIHADDVAECIDGLDTCCSCCWAD